MEAGKALQHGGSGDFRYVAKHERKQFAAFISVQEQWQRIKEDKRNPFAGDSLSDSEFSSVLNAQAYVASVLRPVLAKVSKLDKTFGPAIDPYSWCSCQYDLQARDVSGWPDATACIASLLEHPAISLLASVLKNVPARPENGDSTVSAIIEIQQRLNNGGPSVVSSDIEELLRSGSTRVHSNIGVCLVFALVCLRSTLQNVAQLIYQAAFEQKAIALTSDNVHTLHSHGSNLVTGHLEVSTTDQDGILFVVPGHIMVANIKFKRDAQVIAGTYSLHGFNLNFDVEFGNTVRLTLSELDQNLCSYGGILSHIRGLKLA